jgi:hypothetical protein
MVNEYGVKLDLHGYAPSIFKQDEGCFVCGLQTDLVRHEIFHGFNRQRSKELGLWVNLCPRCHMKLHAGKEGLDGLLKFKGCQLAMEHFGWTPEDFRLRFGKFFWEA